jgi:uncharacterized protein YjbI with pentapeptide repeats
MPNPQHLAKLKEGVEAWNQWLEDKNLEANLSGADLAFAHLRGANLRRADLSEADLVEADLRGADLTAADLSGADLGWAHLPDAHLSEANLSGAKLVSATLNRANLVEADLSEADLRGAYLSGSQLLGANLREANLSGAGLSGADLGEADLSEADLREANLRGANLRGANLRGANLSGAQLLGANLSGANLSGAHLRNADLGEAELREADLREADLIGANFTRADLRAANFTRADLSAADFTRADLSGVDLRFTRLEAAQLDAAIVTGVKLWEAQRTDWWIRSIVCEHAFWDRDGQEATYYAPGEFERLHSEQPRIELLYQGGISSFEVNTLPALLCRLEIQHPGSSIRLKSLEETGGGVKVAISVENAQPDQIALIKAEAEHFKAQLHTVQNDLALERKMKEYLGEIISQALANSGGQHVHIEGSATGVVIAGRKAKVRAHIKANDLSGLTTLIEDILRRRDELGGLTHEAQAQLESAGAVVHDELQKSKPKTSVLAGSLKVMKDMAVKVVESTAEKAVSEHWAGIVEQLKHFIYLATS